MTKRKLNPQNNFINIIDQRYGRLFVLERIKNNRHGCAVFLCKCDCGEKITVLGTALRSGHTSSCGCFQKDAVRAAIKTHGLTHTPEYHAWNNAKIRCISPACKAYKDYGARGIKICDRWLNSFDNFFSDMGLRPSAKHSLDRIDNDGNYEPGNCRWATKKEQQNNRRKRMVKIEGREMPVKDACKILGIKVTVVRARLYVGWDMERALHTPVKKRAS